MCILNKALALEMCVLLGGYVLASGPVSFSGTNMGACVFWQLHSPMQSSLRMGKYLTASQGLFALS